MTVKAYPSEARTDVARWVFQNEQSLTNLRNPYTEESLALMLNAVEAAATEHNWERTFPDTDELDDVRAVAADLTPYMETVPDFSANLIAAVAARLGYRHP